MPPKQVQHRMPEEILLAHDAANWDEDTFESVWDDEEEQLVCELARSADCSPVFASG